MHTHGPPRNSLKHGAPWTALDTLIRATSSQGQPSDWDTGTTE